jgi:hypothetical protein
MLGSRSLIARLALFLLLIVAPTAALERAGLDLDSGSRDASASNVEHAVDSELDETVVQSSEPTLRSAARGARARRPAAIRSAGGLRSSLVADLRPSRVPSPVPYPPIRRPLVRLLN